MSIATFPHDRLTLVFDRYGVDVDPGLRGAEYDDGYTSQRPRASRVPHERRLRYRACTKADYLFFQAWHRETLAQGALFFRWRDPVSGEYRRTKMNAGRYRAAATNNRLDSWLIDFTITTIE